MKLFEFLNILKREKFPFKLEYQEWSGSIKVIVDTFSHLEVYCFDENGVTEHTKFIETITTEDKKLIDSIITDLISRPERAWVQASKDLEIQFLNPYRFKGFNGEEYEVTGLLPEFGGEKGVLITSRKSDEEAFLMAELTNEYFITGLSPRYYDKYDRESFIETLSEWGWIGKGEKPKWMKKN